MIANITLRNFKCFRVVSLFPKLVTVFIGPNGTGKSGVLQSLLLLKQWTDTESTMELEGNLVCLDPRDFLNHGVRSEAPQAVNEHTRRRTESHAGCRAERVRAAYGKTGTTLPLSLVLSLISTPSSPRPPSQSFMSALLSGRWVKQASGGMCVYRSPRLASPN